MEDDRRRITRIQADLAAVEIMAELSLVIGEELGLGRKLLFEDPIPEADRLTIEGYAEEMSRRPFRMASIRRDRPAIPEAQPAHPNKAQRAARKAARRARK